MRKNESVSLLIVLDSGTPSTRRTKIRTRLEAFGVQVRHVEGDGRSYLEVRGDDLPVRTLSISSWDGVAAVVPLSPGAPHASWGGGKGEALAPTVVRVGSEPATAFDIGAGHFALIAGPCAIESLEQARAVAEIVRDAGAVGFRGGAYKPRTSPYAFQGLESEGLAALVEIRRHTGLPIVTEVLDPRHIESLAAQVDLLQVGSRNMQNYALLKELGQLRCPVLLKRGFAATVEEWLLAAEYILSGGNDQVVLCERGIRSGAASCGTVLDLGAIAEVRRRSHLPILVDPSHSAVHRHRVAPLARAAVAAGADGLLIEVHRNPEEALSDGRQALEPAEFRALVPQIEALRALIDPTAAALGESVDTASNTDSESDREEPEFGRRDPDRVVPGP